MGKDQQNLQATWLDISIKLLPLIGGVIYLSGIIVVSVRLAYYGALAASLIDFQYFIAGIPLSVILGITGVNVWVSQKVIISRGLAGWLIVFNSFIALGFYFLAKYLADMNPISNWWLVVIFAMFQLFIFTTFVPTRFVKKGRWLFAFFDYVYLILILVFFTCSAAIIYEALPQGLGGGRVETIRLYVDEEQTPNELIDPYFFGSTNGPTLTIPLKLIYRNASEYVVYPLGQDFRDGIWILKDDAVYSVLIPQ
jgi:hypothetical protein